MLEVEGKVDKGRQVEQVEPVLKQVGQVFHLQEEQDEEGVVLQNLIL